MLCCDLNRKDIKSEDVYIYIYIADSICCTIVKELYSNNTFLKIKSNCTHIKKNKLGSRNIMALGKQLGDV